MSKELLLLLFLATLTAAPARAGAIPAALQKNSPFKSVTLAQVSDGQILESREGASLSPEIEAVQTCFIIKAAPETVADRLLHWNPAGKPGLEVSRHEALSSPAGPDAFTPTLDSVFKSSAASWIIKQSKNAKDPSCELLLTPAEKGRLVAASTPSKLADAWAGLLSGRFDRFHGGGAPGFQALCSALPRLGTAGISGPSGATDYWEVGEVSGRSTFSEGASWSDSADGATRVLDGEFFVTSEYSASLNVSTLWPVSIGGKAATLVWRIDSAFSDQFTDQSGAERIASASLILSSTKKTIKALQQIGK
jgi:hypothetical protein